MKRNKEGETIRKFKKYIVIEDHGSEGWSIHRETDDFNEAVIMRETCMANAANDKVYIFKSVELVVTEKGEA